MKRIISTFTTAALLAGALFLPAMLRAEEKSAAGTKEGFADRMREKLDISEQQEAQIKAARRAKRDASEKAKSDMKAAHRTLRDQLEDKAPEKELSASLDKLAAARKAVRAEDEKFEAAMASILTPTQRAKMAVAMGRHHGGMRGKRGGEPHGDDQD